MATRNNVYRSYSMEYGTFVGLSWGALFYCYVEGISYNHPLLLLLCFALAGVAFVLPFLLALRMNSKMFLAGEKLSYWQGLLFSFSMFMYASMMNGLLVFLYFRFLDDGLLFEQLNSLMGQEDIVATYQQIGMGEQYEQMMHMMEEVDALSPLEKTLAIFNNNFFFGLLLSFVVAIVASYDLKNISKYRQSANSINQ